MCSITSEVIERTPQSGPGRSYELDIMRRSLAMLTPGVPALRREEALRLLDELVDLQQRLDKLKEALRALAESV